MPEGDSKPSRIGGFELLGRLGKGGMGTVLKARQVSMDRLVALKILPRKLAEDERFVQRFLREARSAAKLRHPNIVQAFDVGQTEGYYFFAMEFVDGETLADVVRRDGPLDPSRALDVMKQTVSALAAAHKEGIVHRDIKPSNIMLDKEGQVRVTDFGLAKRTEGDVAVTADGAVVGTPAYVAPEMAKGGEADHRSDLYSLGATIFCALAGRPPFEGKHFSEVIAKKVMEAAPPLASLAPRIDRRLCHIVDRLLRKNPEGRYPSATALLDDLNGLGKLQSVAAAARAEGRAMIAEAPTLAMTEGKRRQRAARLEAQRPKSKRTTLIAVGAIVALLAVVGIVLATRKPKGTATSVPDNRKDLTTKTPQDAKKTTVAVVDDAEAKRIAAELAEKERIAKARRQGEDLLKQADAAIAAKDFVKARAIIKAVEELGLPDLDGQAKSKLKEIASREKSAAEWAKWDTLKADAKKLIDAGKLDEAAKLLKGAKALPLEDIDDRIAEQMESIESARRKAAAAALAAYRAESDRLWARFKARDYPEADKLLAALAADPRFGVRPAGAENIRVGDADSLADHLKADQEAAKLLKEFWAAAEKGVAARKGTVSIKGALGNIIAAEKGVITIQTPRKESVARSLYDLDTKQALAYAAVVLKDDEHSRLAEAVFRIAEADKLDRAELEHAEKLLADAGNPPGLAFYRDRLDILTLGAAEVAARRAWAEIEAIAKDKLTKAQIAALGNLLDRFEKDHGQSKTGKQVADQIAALRARAGRAAEPIVYTEWPFDAAEARRRQAETAEALGVPVEQDIDLGNGVKMTFVLIPGGEFLMGSPPTKTPGQLQRLFGGNVEWYEREFPQHRVKITRPFWLGKYEVTQEQWQAVMSNNPSKFAGKPKNPVETVSWNDCEEFLQRLSAKLKKKFRLPTEAEWEYGCRAGTATEFYFGNDAARVLDFSWPGVKTTAPVGMKKPNAWGLHDMIGTVWQWCGDCFGEYGGADLVDPTGPAGGRDRIIRGGGYGDPATARRSAHRTGIKPGTRLGHVGFRVVLSQEPRQAAEAPKAGEWQSLFDGKTLEGWRTIREARVEEQQIVLTAGKEFSGVVLRAHCPAEDYEVALDAMMDGFNKMGYLVFPVGRARCSWALFGWDGTINGLDRVNGKPYRDNETAQHMRSEQHHWYQLRLRVTRERIEAWIDDAKSVDLPRAGRSFGLEPPLDAIEPLAFVTSWGFGNITMRVHLRNIRLRRLGPEAEPRGEAPKAGEWQSLFDGKTLDGWRIAKGGHFKGEDIDQRVTVADRCIVIAPHHTNTGFACTRAIPRVDYELAFECLCVQGAGNVVFPVGDATSLWEVRNRGGMGIGAEPLDPGTPKPAFRRFQTEDGRWFRCRLRVEKARIQAWADDEQVLDLPTAGYRFGMWAGNDPAKPLGFFTVYDGSVKLRDIRLRRLAGQPGPEFFHGSLRRLAGERVELAYDWSDAAQLDDWKAWGEGAGQVQPEILNGELRLGPQPNLSVLSHKARFLGDIEMSAAWRISVGADYSDLCLWFCHDHPRYYCASVQRTRQRVFTRPSDKTLKACALPCPVGERHTIRVVRSGKAINVWINGRPAIETTDDEYTGGQVGLSAFREKGSFDDVHIIGRLDPEWLKQHPDAAKQVAEAPVAAEGPKAGKWQSLFDGKSLDGWKVPDQAGLKHGQVKVEDGAMVFAASKRVALCWTGTMPRGDYEVEFETSLVNGHRLGSLFFPVGEGWCDLVLGGINGKLVGLAGVDGKGYREGPAVASFKFEPNHCYAVQVRVAERRIRVGVDGAEPVNLPIEGHTFGFTDGRSATKTLALSAYTTTTAVRNIRLRRAGTE